MKLHLNPENDQRPPLQVPHTLDPLEEQEPQLLPPAITLWEPEPNTASTLPRFRAVSWLPQCSQAAELSEACENERRTSNFWWQFWQVYSYKGMIVS